MRRLGEQAAVGQTDRALQRTCLGRIVSLLTLIFIALCVVLWVALFFALSQSSLGGRLPEFLTGPALAIVFFAGLIFCVILAGLIGNWLRRRLWRRLLHRQRWL